MQASPSEGTGKGLIVVISGPSGSGKSTICRQLLKDPGMVWSISVTTRQPRRNERPGVDYHFLTEDQFKAHVERGELVEHTHIFGNWYGTLRQPLEEALREGKLYLMEVDVQGGENVMRAFPRDVLSIFVNPPSLEVLRERLYKRGTDSEAQLSARLRRAEEERRHAHRYHRVVVNDNLDEVVREVRQIIHQTRERKGAKADHR